MRPGKRLENNRAVACYRIDSFLLYFLLVIVPAFLGALVLGDGHKEGPVSVFYEAGLLASSAWAGA